MAYFGSSKKSYFYDVLKNYLDREGIHKFTFEEMFYLANNSTTESVSKKDLRSFFELLALAEVVRVYERDRTGKIDDASLIEVVEYPLPPFGELIEKANEASKKKAFQKSVVSLIGMMNILINGGKYEFSSANYDAIHWAVREGLIKKIGVGERRVGIYKIINPRLVSAYAAALSLKENSPEIFEAYRSLHQGESGIEESALERLVKYGLVEFDGENFVPVSLSKIVLEA